MKTKYSTRDVLRDISSIRRNAEVLLGKGKPYDDFLRFLINYKPLYDDNLPLPTLGNIAKDSGTTYSKVRRYLLKIYEDFLGDDEFDTTIGFNKLEYEFSVKGFEEHLHVIVKGLPFIPRVGENVTLPFFRTYLETDLFYVDSVHHIFEDKKQIILIGLKAGIYSIYWDLRKTKAIETREIQVMDLIENSDHRLKEMLLFEKKDNNI